MREIKLPTPPGTLRSLLGLSYLYPVSMRSVEGDAELSTSAGLLAAKIWAPRRCVRLAQAIGTRLFSHHIRNTASLSRVWITLNKLLYAPLGHRRPGPDIHAAEQVCGRLSRRAQRVSEKNSSPQLGEYRGRLLSDPRLKHPLEKAKIVHL